MKVTSVADILRELTTKVQNGVITKAEATELATLALQNEVNAEEEEEGKTEVAPAPEKKQYAMEPRTRILSLLTQYEESIQLSLKKLEVKINEIIQETEGAALPLGDFNIGNDSNPSKEKSYTTVDRHVGQSKISISASDKVGQLLVTYTSKKEWRLDGINVPVTSSVVEPSCHIPLRQDILQVCADIKDASSSELAWQRVQKSHLDQLPNLEAIAEKSNDTKVLDIIKNKPQDTQAESWGKWATISQVYLLGLDWDSDSATSFQKLKASLKGKNLCG